MCKGKILIAEDDDIQIDLLTDELESEGYEVVAYKDGADIVNMVLKEMPEAVLLDINLPHVSGWEIARLLKKDYRTKDIPVSIVAALTVKEGLEMAQRHGCFDFFPKPTNVSEIIESVAQNILVGRIKRRVSKMIDAT